MKRVWSFRFVFVVFGVLLEQNLCEGAGMYTYKVLLHSYQTITGMLCIDSFNLGGSDDDDESRKTFPGYISLLVFDLMYYKKPFLYVPDGFAF